MDAVEPKGGVLMNDDVSLNLGKVLDELLPQAIVEGLEKVGQIIENQAKEFSPVDDGTLRASITSKVVNDDTAIIGTNVEYAPYVHEGTGIYAEDGRSTPWVYMNAEGKFIMTYGQPPNPFLQDAIDVKMDELPKVFEGLLDKQRGLK